MSISETSRNYNWRFLEKKNEDLSFFEEKFSVKVKLHSRYVNMRIMQYSLKHISGNKWEILIETFDEITRRGTAIYNFNLPDM